MLEVASEVAAALAGGGAVVALESTIIAHGLPRPDNARIAREIEAAVREQGAVPATIALLDGTVRVGLSDAQLDAVASRDDVAKLQRARPAAGGGAGRERRDDGGRHRARRRAGGHPRVRHRRARRRAPRGAGDVGRVGRPRRALAHGDLRRVLGREVDPRRARDARAAGDARGRRRRLRHRSLPGLLPRRLGPPRAVAARLAGARSPRRCGRATSSGLDGALVVANPLPTSSSTRSCTSACSPRRSRPPAREGDPRARRHPVPARALPRARPAARACARTCGWCSRNARAGRRRSPWRRAA